MIATALWIVALLGLVALGSWVSFRAGYRAATDDLDEAICGCGHHRAFHKGVGECHWHPDGYPALTCPCQGYIGPEPMPKFLMPHMTEGVEK